MNHRKDGKRSARLVHRAHETTLDHGAHDSEERGAQEKHCLGELGYQLYVRPAAKWSRMRTRSLRLTAGREV